MPALDWLRKAGRVGVVMVESAAMARGRRRPADGLRLWADAVIYVWPVACLRLAMQANTKGAVFER